MSAYAIVGPKSIVPAENVNEVAYCDSGSIAENFFDVDALTFSGRKWNV